MVLPCVYFDHSESLLHGLFSTYCNFQLTLFFLQFPDKSKGAVPPQPKFTPKKEKDALNKQEKSNDKKVSTTVVLKFADNLK